MAQVLITNPHFENSVAFTNLLNMNLESYQANIFQFKQSVH